MAQQSGVTLGLPTFGGNSGSVSRFISDFKTYVAFQGWDTTKQASLLPLCLTGIARDAYDCLPEASKKSISLAFTGLKEAFPSHSVVEAQVQLRGLKFDPKSDLDAFAIRLRRLVSSAFPEGEVDSLLFNYFMQTLPMEFQSRLISDGVTSFDTALVTVRNMCCAARLSASQPEPVRQVCSETDQLRRKVAELEGKLARLGGTRGPRSERSICFCCGGEGHVRRNCRYKASICYQCGVKGHLARVCRDRAMGNLSGAVGSVPPGRPPFRQRGAMSTPHNSVLWSQTPAMLPQAVMTSYPQRMADPQVFQQQHAHQPRASSAALQPRTSTA